MAQRMIINLNELIVRSVSENITRLNVAAIIVNHENKILLCRRNRNKKIAPGAWHMPGGKVESGETIEGAIARELIEELSIKVIQVFGYSGIEHNHQVNGEKHRTVFVGVEAEGVIRMNSENDACRYVAFEEIPDYLEPALVKFNEQAATYGLGKTTERSVVYI